MRIAVVGAGRHAHNVLYPAIIEAGLELVAVCARDEQRAQATAKRWNATRYHTSVEDLTSAGGVDGVLVAVPADAYRPIVERCLEAGLPVFCEKPAGQTASELRELAALSETAQREVVVGYMKRFAPAYRRAREIVSAPQFGAPTMAHFTFAMGQIDEYLADPRYYLIDNPIHMIDLARYLLGELGQISAVLNVVPEFGLSVSVVARADSGATCSFDFGTTASFVHQGELAEVYGRGNAVKIDNVDTCIYRPLAGPAETWRPNYTLPIPANSGLTTMGFIPALEHFREVVAGRAKNESDLESAARTLDTTEMLWNEIEPAWSALLGA